MRSTRPELAKLAACEASILSRERERARIPHAISDGDARVAAATARVEAVRGVLDAVDKERRSCEASIADAAAKKSKFQQQSALVKTNHEYTTLLHEIEAQEARIRTLEDEILAQMEKAEAAQPELAQAETDMKVIDAEVRGANQALRAKLVEVESSLVELIAERTTLLAALGPLTVATYHRVLKSKGSGIARLVGVTCMGCHRSVPPETQNRVRAGEIHGCAVCQRILVPELET